MKNINDRNKLVKTNASVTPDLSPLASLNQSMKNLKKVKNSIKTTERDYSTSPYYSTKNISSARSKDQIKVPKKSNLSKDHQSNYEIFTISSSKSHEKNIKIQKPLPKLTEKTSLSGKLANINIVLNTAPKPLLYLSLNEDLQINTDLINEKSQYKSKTWLENLMSLKEKREGKSLIENLKYYNGLIRDIICRLKFADQDNESILLEKVWRLSLQVIDEHIELVEKGIVKVNQVTEETLKVQNQVEKIKSQCENKVIQLEKDIQRVKLDYILAKDPRISSESKRIERLKPFIQNVKGQIENLVDMYVKGKAPFKDMKIRAGSNNNERSKVNLKRKKSMEFIKFKFLDEYENQQ